MRLSGRGATRDHVARRILISCPDSKGLGTASSFIARVEGIFEKTSCKLGERVFLRSAFFVFLIIGAGYRGCEDPNQLGQAVAVDELHREEGPRPRDLKSIARHDMLVIQRGNRLRLAEESPPGT